jgi:hypothetical protein
MVYNFFGARICGDRWRRQQRDDRKNHDQPPEFHRERLQDEGANGQWEKDGGRSAVGRAEHRTFLKLPVFRVVELIGATTPKRKL